MEMQINWPVSIWYEFLQKGISEQTIEKNVLELGLNAGKIRKKIFFDQNESFYAIFYGFWSQTPGSLFK